jgi:hypothetical protein
MTKETKKYIQMVTLEEIPWHRLPTVYGRATDFPKYIKILQKMEDKKAMAEAGEALAINMEHQDTFWQATPFALIFLLRVFKEAVEERGKNKFAAYLVSELLELFVILAKVIHEVEKMAHSAPLPQFTDMIREVYLWSEDYDEAADELRYEEDEVFPDDLFYSFYYYTYQALLAYQPLFEQLEDKEAKVLCSYL